MLRDPDFARLPDKTKKRIRLQVAAMLAIKRGIAAGLSQNEACRRASSDKDGFHWRGLRRYFGRWKENPCWRSLLHGTGKPRAAIADETARHIWGYMQGNHRVWEAGYRAFMDKWRAGEPVPGVLADGEWSTWQDWFRATWPKRPLPLACPIRPPKGWSYENLLKKQHLRPSKAEVAITRQGIAAARNFLPKIPGTRAGMRPLEYVAFDDVRLDFMVMPAKSGRPSPLLALVCMDLGTGRVLEFGFRASTEREDGVSDSLKRRDMKALVVKMLLQQGWAKDYGMTLILEHGTATVDEAFAKALYDATGGMVRVSYTSMVRGTVFDGGFADRPIGNPRGKSPLESSFNRVHNQLAAEKGQIGARYALAPQSTWGKEKEALALLKQSESMPEDLSPMLTFPFLKVEEAHARLGWAWGVLNNRTNHKLKDFATVQEWAPYEGADLRAMDEWLSASEEDRRNAVFYQRQESPMERHERLMREHSVELDHLDAHSVPLLLEDQRVIRLDCGEIRFQHRDQSCVYGPWDERNQPILAAISERGEGAKCLAYHDHYDTTAIYVTDMAGKWIGTLHKTGGFRRDDKDGVKAAIAIQQRHTQATKDRVAQREPWKAEERASDIAHNNALIIAAKEREASNVHGQVARAVETNLTNKRQEAAQKREDERLARQASAAIAGMAQAPAPIGEDEEDDGL
jgi:hypothetical protein